LFIDFPTKIISFKSSIDERERSISRFIAVLKSSPIGVSHEIIGFLIPLFLSAIPSSRRAVPNQSAPAFSAAFATSINPWP